MAVNLRKGYRRFREFGGWRLLKAYWRMGLLRTMVIQAGRVVVGKTNWEHAYSHILQQMTPKLYQQYHPLLLRLKDKYKVCELERGDNNGKIWTCWLQGNEETPELVLACRRSIRKNIPEKELVVLSYANYSEYVSLPPEIVVRYEEGKIPHALFSDMLRVALLCEYGGTWMDASLLCTGHNFPPKVLDCNLFLFQYLTPGEYRFRGISNWFITARPKHPVLLVLRDMLYQYWRDYDCTLDYYIFHQFFAWIAQEFPTDIADMPRGNRRPPLLLGSHLGDRFNPAWWENLVASCAFHKMNHRVGEQVKHLPDTFYQHIIANYPED